MLELREPGTVEQQADHIALHHDFVLRRWDGINPRAVHRFMHRFPASHSHLEGNGKRGWMPRSFSSNGVKY